MTLESEVLKSIKPTSAQDKKVASVVEELSDKVVTEARKLNAHVETMLVGSVAKSTHLKDPDIDLFMLFPESTPLEQLKEVGLDFDQELPRAKANLRHSRKHYRDYYDEESRDIVGTWYAPEIALLGYEF